MGAILSFAFVAMPTEAQLPVGLRVDDVGSFTFDEREGLPSSVIYDVFRARDQVLWIGTTEGPYRFEGGGWKRVIPGDTARSLQVRMIAEESDGTLWFAGRNAAYRLSRGVWTKFGRAEGIAASPIYSVAVTSAIDGKETVVIGTSAGMWYLAPSGRFETLPTPTGYSPIGLMIATRRESGGGESLWLASVVSGVARYYRGTWSTWGHRDGVNDEVQSLALGATDDSVEALAASFAGAFQLIRGRWSRLSPPGASINRVLRVKNGDHYESWLGTHSGYVLRQVSTTLWDTLDAGVNRGNSPVVAFRAIDDGVGDATVYAGFRAGRLSRMRTARAGRVMGRSGFLSRYVTALSEVRPPGGEPSLLSFRIAVGVQRSSNPGFDRFSPPLDQFNQTVTGFADARATGGSLWVSTSRGPYRLVGETWARDPLSSLPDSLSYVVAGPLPGGGEGVIAAVVSAPLSYRDQAGWHRFPDAPEHAIHLWPVDTIGGAAALWLATRDALHRFDYRTRRWTLVPTPSAVRVSDITAVNAHRLASGEEVVWLSTHTAGLGWARLGGDRLAWHWMNSQTSTVMQNDATAMVVGGDGRVHVATPKGVVTVRPGRAFSDSVSVEDAFFASDGLPHEEATALALSGDGERLWVGTIEGVGMVSLKRDPDSDANHPVPQLVVRAGLEGVRTVKPGETLPFSDRNVTIEYWLDTRQRESATRYRVEFDGEQEARDPWRVQGISSFPALGAGRHVARVWGMDWRGRVAGPVEFAFEVSPPLWRTPIALAVYVLAMFGTVVLFDRWRQATLRMRAAELEANERRLAASEERFRRLFIDGASAQLLVRDHVVFAANPAAAVLLGAEKREALVQQRLESILPTNLPLQAHAGDAPPAPAIETRAVTADGTSIPVAVRRTAITATDDPFEHVEIRDLREAQRLEQERQQLEQQLRESQRLEALGNLAGGVAHDFNNLLTVIQGHAELLRHSGARTPLDEDSLTAILHASDRARGIVRQILTFSRRHAPRRVEVDLGAMLRETGRMLRASIPASVTLTIKDNASGARMLGDPTEMHQLLLNLGANAEYALRQTGGGTLSFTLDVVPPPRVGSPPKEWPTPRCLRLRVTDSGIGMTIDVQRRIFEPFFTTKPVGEGTGLGLSVLHGIVGGHDGTVEVSSAPGKGSTFEIHFPAVAASIGTDAPATGDVAPGDPAPAPPAARESILVVDDEKAVARVTTMLLKAAGYRASSFFAPADALRAIEAWATPIDLVITDQSMPGMSGDALAARIHALRPELPIIIATGYSQRLDARALECMGVRRILEKPFLEGDLLAAVDEVLQTRRS